MGYFPLPWVMPQPILWSYLDLLELYSWWKPEVETWANQCNASWPRSGLRRPPLILPELICPVPPSHTQKCHSLPPDYHTATFPKPLYVAWQSIYHCQQPGAWIQSWQGSTGLPAGTAYSQIGVNVLHGTFLGWWNGCYPSWASTLNSMCFLCFNTITSKLHYTCFTFQIHIPNYLWYPSLALWISWKWFLYSVKWCCVKLIKYVLIFVLADPNWNHLPW